MVLPGHQDGVKDLFDCLPLFHIEHPVPNIGRFVHLGVLPVVVLRLLGVGLLFLVALDLDPRRDKHGGAVFNQRGRKVHHRL